jgi:hypothetical protein
MTRITVADFDCDRPAACWPGSSGLSLASYSVPLDSAWAGELPAARTVAPGRVTVAGDAAAGATDRRGPALMIVTVTVHWQTPGRATVGTSSFK